MAECCNLVPEFQSEIKLVRQDIRYKQPLGTINMLIGIFYEKDFLGDFVTWSRLVKKLKNWPWMIKQIIQPSETVIGDHLLITMNIIIVLH